MAKVWVPETRVLCEHSAAWMAVLVFSAEQPGLLGYLPLVLDEAGSRVAETVAATARREMTLVSLNIMKTSEWLI